MLLFFGNDLMRVQWITRFQERYLSPCTLLCFPCLTSCIQFVYLSYIAPPLSSNNTWPNNLLLDGVTGYLARRLRRGWRRNPCVCAPVTVRTPPLRSHLRGSERDSLLGEFGEEGRGRGDGGVGGADDAKTAGCADTNG